MIRRGVERAWVYAAGLALGAALAAIAGCAHAPKRPPLVAPGTLPPGEVSAPRVFPSGAPEIRIGLWVDSTAVTIGAPAGARLSFGADERHSSHDTTYVVWADSADDGVRLDAGDGHTRRADHITIASAHPNVSLTVAGRAYRGQLDVFRGRRGGVTVVNVVPVEEYLRGVVPAEIGRLSDTLLAAVEAQAVAARTYALGNIGRHKEDGFDLLPTVQDQVYEGVKGEQRTADAAVWATWGLVATYEGAFIRANYSSTCGGKTAAIDEVWHEAALPFLRSVRDRGGPEREAFCKTSRLYRWHEVWPADEFLDLLATYGPAVFPEMGPVGHGDLVAVRVRDRGPSHRVRDLEIRTQDGVYHVGGDRIRLVFRRPGHHESILRSSLFDVTVMRSGGRVVAVAFDGGGYGHGVGMCQVGAIGMARDGYAVGNIIGHYYRGARLSRRY